MVAILGYSRQQILAAVRDMYTAVAEAPASPFHFPVGRSACELLGYPADELERVPPALVESFAGVGYPFRGAAVKAGDTCLDLGAGAGNDSLIAASRVGPSGRVLALDLTPAMTRKLRQNASAAGADNVHPIQGSAEALPLADASVDSITSNGALNLIPDKRRAVAEMSRVLRPGGRLQIADVVIRRPVTVDCDSDPRLWVECVVGATIDDDLLALFGDAGFEDIEIVRRIDYFAHSPSAQTREIAAGFDAHSVELAMRRGPHAPGRLLQWLRRSDPRRLALSLWRRGWMGVAGLSLALLSCYGMLAAAGLLAALGVGLAFNDALWAGTIAVFAVLTALCVVPGTRQHGARWPAALAAIGAATVLYALFVDYRVLTELAGFVLLAAGVAADIALRRRRQTRLLGLTAGTSSPAVPGRASRERPSR